MLRSFLLLLFIILSTPASALSMLEENTEVMCREEALEYGHKHEGRARKDHINPQCKNYLQGKSSFHLSATSPDKKLKALAGLNLIFLEEEKVIAGKKEVEKRVIAGRMSQLKTVEAIALSHNKKWIAILQKVDDQMQADAKNEEQIIAREILIFQAALNGNVSPYRILRLDEINHATSLAFHPGGKELYLINKKMNEILSFNPESDFRIINEEKKTKVIRRFKPDEKSFRKPASIDFMDNNILVLDTEDNKLISLNPSSNKVEWSMNQEEIGLADARHIRYSKKDKKLIIADKQGNSVSFDSE